MDIYAVKINNKVELYAGDDGLTLEACRITFKEITKSEFAIDSLGSGFLTLSMNEVKILNDQLSTILKEVKSGSTAKKRKQTR